MLIDDLKSVYLQNKEKNPLYIRTSLKEMIQYYVLHFISQSIWAERLIFKGGMCLRFFFDLPRLSEDLDFDIIDAKIFDLSQFTKDLKKYFVQKLQCNRLEAKLSGNKRIIYLKFSLLKEIDAALEHNESNIVFVRIDFAPTVGKTYQTEISIKSTYNFSILIKRYALPDLFSGKIAAILTREAFEGKTKKERIKGRDYYDLIWFLEKGVKPHWEYLKEITAFSKSEALKQLDQKVQKINSTFLQTDLMPFFADIAFIKNFSKNFQNLYQNYRTRLL